MDKIVHPPEDPGRIVPATGQESERAPIFASLPILELWMDFGSEVLDFVAERVREEVRTQHRVLHCRTPAQFFDVHLEFAQKAFDDYLAEAARLSRMGGPADPAGGDRE